MMPTRIALIGHCRADEFALRSALGSIVPDAEYVMVCKSADVATDGASADLCLVNRALVGRFKESDGIEVIQGLLASSSSDPVVILVSNFPDAQARAVTAGAQPGFGKHDLHNDEMRRSINDALSTSHSN